MSQQLWIMWFARGHQCKVSYQTRKREKNSIVRFIGVLLCFLAEKQALRCKLFRQWNIGIDNYNRILEQMLWNQGLFSWALQVIKSDVITYNLKQGCHFRLIFFTIVFPLWVYYCNHNFALKNDKSNFFLFFLWINILAC